MDISLFVVLSLVTWRISSCLAYERGPFELFEKFRYRAGVRYDVYSNVIAEKFSNPAFDVEQPETEVNETPPEPETAEAREENQN